MRRNTDRANTRATTAMRNAKSLVQVQVADIGTELWRGAMPDKGVQIGPVDIDLTAGFMDDIAQIGNRLLEDTMR